MKYIVGGLVLLTILTLSSTQSVPAYPCDVSGCQTCSYYNVCGVCKNNYILKINMTTSQSYCAQVYCPENCASCLANYTCEKCDTGYYVTSQGYCSQTVPQYTCGKYCLACNSTTNCLLCQYGFNIQSGQCLSNFNPMSNCMVLFSPNKCQICSTGYLSNIAYGCTQVPGFTCNVSNCFQCYENNKCGKCLTGFNVNVNHGCTALSCSIKNCTICQNAQTCLECATGFTLNNNTCTMNIYPCNISNCQVCSAANTCSSCAAGYKVVQNNTKDFSVGTYCSKYTQAVGNNAQFMSNCDMLGSLPFGTDTILQVGCLKCATNFVNIGGMCLANLTLVNYTCNVQNCIFCSQNNYCGQCGEGYYVELLSGGICMKMYSPLPYCQLTTLFAPICLACQEGYALNVNYQCVWMTNMTCNVDGCSYCLMQNACWTCRAGFNKITDNGTVSCEAQCNITNCYQCSSTTTCGLCVGGYILNDDNTQCTQASQVTVNCTSVFQNCQECNALYCTKCQSGFNLNNATNSCCTAPLQNRKGCAVYQDACSNDCIACSLGYYMFLGRCITLPCNISNCAYCFRSNQCQLCSEGYTLSGNTCTKFTKPSTCTQSNCVSCNSNGTCNTCITGYRLYNGVCVCNFQNCLSCMGDGFCKVCAFPTVQTYINSAGCLPSISVLTLCNVPNCLNCKYLNQCSECDLGYTLQKNGTCSRNPCESSSNCLLCSNDRNFCFTCKQGYIQSEFFGASCIQIPQTYECEVQGCAVCKTSTTCETCVENYLLTSDEQCSKIKCVDNCLVCFQNNNCTLCEPGYYFTTDNTCMKQDQDTITCTINYCVQCSEDNNTEVCDECDFGLAPSDDKLQCVPASCSAPNCQLCFESFQFLPTRISACFVCEQGYFINSYYQCVKYSPAINTPPCDVYSCLYCHFQNQCAFCLIGWNETDGICQTNLFCDDQNCQSCTNATYCVTCASQYKNSLGLCQPQCNISDCVTCATLQTCGSCVDTYVLSSDAKSCVCKDTFVVIDNACACAVNSTQYEGVCYTCNVTNCTLCQQNNVCSTCNTSYYLKDSKCSCPDDTFEVVNGLCQCPSGKLAFGTGADQTCIACNITYCSSCSAVDTCATCQDTFQLGNNTCACPDDTFQIQNNLCVCPTDFKQYDKTCIQCNIDYCSYCQTNNSCSECVSSFTLVSSTSCECTGVRTFFNDFCYTCNVQYCKTCNATNTCFQCDQTFNVTGTSCACASGFTLYNSTCIQCNVTNCSVCAQANVCNTCDFEYTKTDGKCIACSIRGCQQCQTPNFCKTCFNNEQISSVGTCLSCVISGCAICETNTTCVSCNDGLTFNSNKTACVNCSVTGCLSCSSNNTCQVCLPGFILSSGQCTVCAYPCLTCNSDGSCATCVSPFSNLAGSNGSCFTCSIQNCFKCPTPTSTTCTTCNTGFSLTSNNQCKRICGGVFCNQCSSSTNCTACTAGYTPFQGGCQVCSATNCLSCLQTSPSVCTECGQGYYLEDGTCYACASSNCQTCNSTTCLTFKTSTNQKPFINNQGQVTPVLCNFECLSCSDINPQICLICKPGYAIQNGNCISCQAPCKTCADNSPTTCLSCYGNAFLSNSQCKICTPSSNCLTCTESNLTKCTTCPYGFSLASNSTCVKGCPSFCLSCSNSSFCDVCQSGFSADSEGACLPCISNCRDCSGTSQGVCLSCGNGFFLNSNNVCSSCPEYCMTCTPQSKCQTCYPGYTLTASFTCAQTCSNPCATCSQTNSSVCFSCIGGYNYDSTTNKCTKALNCTGGVCELCPFGYTLSGGNCFTCNSTCARCETTNMNTCTSCYNGNYLSNSKCVACPVGCETCSSGTNCLTCQTGYTFQSSPVLTTVSCVKCSGYCSECVGSPSTCTACITGYVLNGWTCLSSFNYGFNVTLNSTLATFYLNYQGFLLGIADAVNSTLVNTVTITSITQGSVIVNGNVTTTAQSNSNDASSQFSSLGSILSGGSSIANMPIISSSIDANGGQIPSSNSGPNLAIILGICIPVGVILIGLLIYCCCVRKNSPPQSDYSEKNMEPGTTVRQTFELSRDNTQRIETVEVKEEQ